MEFTAEYVPEIINITKIKEGFYIGDEIAGTNLDVIIQFKLTHMINATGNQIQNKWETLGIKYLTINWRDTPSQMLFDSKDELANKIVSFVDDALCKGEGLLGFSYTSQSRICVVVVIYLMKKFKWCLSKCIEFIKSRKNDVNIQKHFITQLMQFEKRLIQRGEGVKAVPWSVDDIKDPEERLLRNTYVNSLGSDPKLVGKDNVFEVKKKRHIGWADRNAYKKEPLVHVNQAMDLCFQKEVKSVTVHKRMRPSRSCMKYKKGGGVGGGSGNGSGSGNMNVVNVNVNVNASAMQLGQQQRSKSGNSNNNNNNNVNSVSGVSVSQQVSKGIMSQSTSLPSYVGNNVTGIKNVNSVSVNDYPSKKEELFNNNVNVGMNIGVGVSAVSLNNNNTNKYSQNANVNTNNFTLPLQQQRIMSAQHAQPQTQPQKTDPKYFGQNLTQHINNGLFIQEKINNYLQSTNNFINNIQQQKQPNIDNTNTNNIMYNTPSFGNESSNVFNIAKHNNTLPLQNDLSKPKDTKIQLQQQQQQPHHQLLNIPKQFSDKNIKSNTLTRDHSPHMQFSPAIAMNQHNNNNINIQNRTLSKDNITNNKLFQNNFTGNNILNMNHNQSQQQQPSLMKNPCKLIYI